MYIIAPLRTSILRFRPSFRTSASTRSPMRGGADIGVILAISSRGIARVVKLYFIFGLSGSCIESLLPRQSADGACRQQAFLLELYADRNRPDDRKTEIRCHHELLRA